MADMDKKYNLDETRLFYDYADGMAVIIDSATGIYYGMNAVSSAAFDSLVNGASPASVLAAVRALPGCPAGISEGFAAFMEQLAGYGLLNVSDVPGLTATPMDTVAAADGFYMGVDQYADIQEILLADPIHDVDSAHGWPVLKDPK